MKKMKILLLGLLFVLLFSISVQAVEEQIDPRITELENQLEILYEELTPISEEQILIARQLDSLREKALSELASKGKDYGPGGIYIQSVHLVTELKDSGLNELADDLEKAQDKWNVLDAKVRALQKKQDSLIMERDPLLKSLVEKRERELEGREESRREREKELKERDKDIKEFEGAGGMETLAKKCDPELGSGNTVIFNFGVGEEKKWKDMRFDNVYTVKVLERIGNTVNFKVNDKETGFVKENQLVSADGLNLYLFEAKGSKFPAIESKVHFCISEKEEAKLKYQVEKTQEEVKETKGLLARIVDFLKNLFGFE